MGGHLLPFYLIEVHNRGTGTLLQFSCKNGVKNTPEKHWFLGILLAGTKKFLYLCNMKTQSERERIKIEGRDVSASEPDDDKL